MNLIFKLFTCCLTLVVLSACDNKTPANIYQEALFNKTRPAADKEQDNKRKAEQVLTLIEPKPGMTVLDFAAGTGYYSELFSHIVGEQGKVYLHNIKAFSSEKKDKAINARVKHLKNTERLDTNFQNPNLPENIDIIFLSKVFHDFYVARKSKAKQADKNNLIKAFYSILKPGGKLVIIDHNMPTEGFDTKTITKLHRINADFVKKELNDQGFKLIAQSDALRNPNDDYSKDIWNSKVKGKTDQFILIFEK